MSIFLENWQLIIGGVTTLTAFIYGYKKQRTDNISDIQNVYNGLIKDVENRIDTMRKQMQENSDKMLEMEAKIQELHDENIVLRKENTTLKSEINKLKKKQ
jgi:peptidoglycan hydrolase CwlO-like protein